MSEGLDIVHAHTGRDARAGDFTAVVDMLSKGQVQRGVWRDQRVQVDHRTSFLPQKRTDLARNTTHPGCAHNLALGIDCVCTTSRAQVTEIGHHSVLPKKSVV